MQLPLLLASVALLATTAAHSQTAPNPTFLLDAAKQTGTAVKDLVAGVEFGSFDILSDEEVRQGLKTFSNWPTYPQLYGQGKLVGGLDIMQELAEAGELVDSLQA